MKTFLFIFPVCLVKVFFETAIFGHDNCRKLCAKISKSTLCTTIVAKRASNKQHRKMRSHLLNNSNFKHFGWQTWQTKWWLTLIQRGTGFEQKGSQVSRFASSFFHVKQLQLQLSQKSSWKFRGWKVKISLESENMRKYVSRVQFCEFDMKLNDISVDIVELMQLISNGGLSASTG